MKLQVSSHPAVIQKRSRQSGGALTITLILMTIVFITALAYLGLISYESRAAFRQQAWHMALPLAEAGLEEALINISFNGTNALVSSSNFWSRTGVTNTVSRSLAGGQAYRVSVDVSKKPLIITSTGTVPLPGVLGAGAVSRTVQVLATNCPPVYKAIQVKGAIKMSGGAVVDSYDSSNPLYSTNGSYAASLARPNGNVATDSTAKPAITLTGGAYINGNVQTGPGGTVSGSYSGTFTDNMNVSFPDAQLPSGYTGSTPLPGIIGGTNYVHVLNGNVQMSDITLAGGLAAIVTASNTIVYVTGDIKTSGSSYIYIQPGASVTFYIGGKVDLSGTAILNAALKPANCLIYGLNTCTKINLSGSSAGAGVVYAPYADIIYSGSSAWCGSFVGNTFTSSGGAGIHYDEALANMTSANFTVIAWKEL